MNSYPPELLAQLAPVMFVAGLDVQAPAPAVEPEVTTPGDQPRPPQQDVFEVLSLRLRDALVNQRKPAIWQPEKTKTFQVVLVDKDVRFPPRKIAPSRDLTQSAVYHSPLSPLTPTSPLHPDGLIAPIWIRKHTQLVPSVFVFFTRLYEAPAAHLARSPLDPIPPEKEAEEKRRDAELSADIAQRKKSTGDRGIKLTVVLLASRKMLDDPALDTRLSFIRRQSGLDSRAALFVLSPVSPVELGEFIKSLQQALYDPAVEYYTSHSKRVRRKRNRHAQSTSSYMPPHSPLASNAPRPLRPEGWTVRYEYKMACFAEFRGEDEVALKHYQDAYSTLVLMFGSAATLPPRTKRWAEAKVLADCVNIKICKLYLYNNEHSLALSQHNAHIRKFADFSRGWGIGEETFEFWSWIARQHRVFAELLEQGIRSTLILPTHLPTTGPSQTQAALLDEMRVLGLNPANALQHPGFFYYLAAGSTERRRRCFLAVDAAGPSAAKNSPGYANEKKVDHFAIVLELYTKAYELFKKHSAANVQGNGRLSLRIAYQIAHTYYEASKFDMAVRFFERISKTYRREKWGVMLRPLLSTWYACAQQLGDVELSVRLLIEMLAYGREGENEDEDPIEDDLLAILKNTMPSSLEEPVLVDLSESALVFVTSVVFWKSSVAVNERVAFQLSLKAPAAVSIASLPFASLTLFFSHRTHPVIIRHALLEKRANVTRIDLGDVLTDNALIEVEGNLRWNKRDSIVLTGAVASSSPGTVTVSKALLTLKEGSWTVEIPILDHTSDDTLSSAAWYSTFDPPTSIIVRRSNVSEVSVRHEPHRLDIDFTHPSPAYLDEEYPIVVNVTNTDDRSFDVLLDVLLQPTEIDDAVNSIQIDEERSSSLLKGVSLGRIAPGATASKTIYLTNIGAAGDRILDISIQSAANVPAAADDTPSADVEHNDSAAEDTEATHDGGIETMHLDTAEALQTLTIATVAPISVEHDVRYMHSRKPMPALTDLAAYESDYWDESVGGEAIVSLRMACAGPHGISVETARLVRKNGPHAKVVHCTMDKDELTLGPEWFPGDEFAAVARVSMMLEDEAGSEDAIAGPGHYELVWRRINPDGTHGPLSTSNFALPPLTPPRPGLLALLTLPASARLHVATHAHLLLRNLRAERTADISVSLEADPAGEPFLVAGARNARVPTLMPGTEVRLSWILVPLECGYVRAPRVRVVDRRGEGENEGIVVRVIDTRREGRGER
ncbi:Gryzun, putative trafficking through golgi-domain-containing protein, partial [Vararia minispora EC-137]